MVEQVFDAIDSSGGILILCRAPEVIWGKFTVSIHITLADGFSLWISVVYGPSVHGFHEDSWKELYDLANIGRDSWIIGGEFNVTRCTWEKSHDHTISCSICSISTNGLMIVDYDIPLCKWLIYLV